MLHFQHIWCRWSTSSAIRVLQLYDQQWQWLVEIQVVSLCAVWFVSIGKAQTAMFSGVIYSSFVSFMSDLNLVTELFYQRFSPVLFSEEWWMYEPSLSVTIQRLSQKASLFPIKIEVKKCKHLQKYKKKCIFTLEKSISIGVFLYFQLKWGEKKVNIYKNTRKKSLILHKGYIN